MLMSTIAIGGHVDTRRTRSHDLSSGRARAARRSRWSLTFGPSGPPPMEELARVAEERGYQVLHDSLRITFTDSLPAWRFQVAAMDRALSASAVSLAQEMSA